MKKLTIEEKAEAYDEAIEKGRQILNTPYTAHWGIMKEVVEHLLPELKESKDEKIRKAIVKMVSDIDGGSPFEKYGIIKKEALAWLEKQGEQGNNEDEAILHRFSFYSYKDEPNILYLAGLYVNDEYRNKGIGTKILKIADEVAVSMKCSSILLKTEIGSNAEKLYKNNGYSVFRREENQVWLEKHFPQPKQEWSKEDEFNYDRLKNFLEVKEHEANSSLYQQEVHKTLDWLKSLKNRHTWKPSDMQMKALNDINTTGSISYIGQGQELINLYNDLKKLKE